MNEPRDDTSHGAAWITGLIAALVFYILSPGPVFWMCNKTGISRDGWLDWVYWPLENAYTRSEHVKNFYDAWFSLFGVR
jgi:hypothetical protein